VVNWECVDPDVILVVNHRSRIVRAELRGIKFVGNQFHTAGGDDSCLTPGMPGRCLLHVIGECRNAKLRGAA